MSYYRKHLFFCLNQRDASQTCCHQAGAEQMLHYAKQRIETLGLAGSGQIRINKSGCLGRCHEGPVIVVYPDGVWYRYLDEEDIEAIIQQHIIHGAIVKRLALSTIHD